jgi:membrane protease YdiL (CAAX protease family)
MGAAITIVDSFLGKAALPIIRPAFLGLLNAIAAFAILWGLFVYPRRYRQETLGLGFSPATLGRLGIGFLGGAALAGLSVGIAVLAKGIELHRAPSYQAPSISDVGLWAAGALFGALAEELVYRAGPVGILRTAFPRSVALIAPGIVFAITHISNQGMSPLAFGNTILAGIFLGLLFLHPMNEPTVPGLGLAVGVHAGWNLALRLLGVPVSGFVAQGRYFQLFSVNETWSGGTYGVEGGLAGTLVFGVGAALVYWHSQRSESSTS